jgi:hypothetical protein
MVVEELRKLFSVAHLMVLLWLRQNVNFFIFVFSVIALFVIGLFELWLVLAPYVLVSAIVFLSRLYLEEPSEALAFFLNVNNVQDIAWFIVKHVAICLFSIFSLCLYQLSDANVNVSQWVFTIIGCFLFLHLTFGIKSKLAIIMIGVFSLVFIRALLISGKFSGAPEVMFGAAAVLVVLNLIRIRNEYSSFF